MRKRTIVGLVLVAGWWVARGGDDGASAPPARPQAAVLPDGFAVLVDAGNAGRRVLDLDRAASTRHARPVRLDREMRVVGRRTGPSVGWQDGTQLKLGRLDGDGNPENVTTWGKHVTQLCAGAATNEHRFGVGWLESDGKVWMVHGPAYGDAAVDAVAQTTTAANAAAKVTWCGIASADRNIVLAWRDGARWFMNFCGKHCSSLAVGLPIAKDDTMLGFGCVSDSCLFAMRDRHGATKLVRVTERAKAITRPLDDARADTSVSIVGAGGRAFAIAYTADDGRNTVRRITVDGTFTHVWHFDTADDAPSLAWADGALLVALAPERMYALDMAK